MRKTLSDLAEYLKNIMPPAAKEAYAIQPVFKTVANEENIQNGVFAFRGFLNRMFDVLIAEGDAFDTSKKVAHEYENRTGLSIYYPFLHNVNIMLINMGYQGVLSETAGVLICGNTIFNEKLSVSKNLECLRFLTDCGICIDGIDLNSKKQDLSCIKGMNITYPDDPSVLTGMKVLAISEKDHRTLVNQDVLLRCDYRALRDKFDAISIVQDTIMPLSPDVQDFVLGLHRRYLDKGITCIVEVKGFHIYIKYCYRRKDVWGVNASLSNGYHINVKPINTHQYTDAIKTFHPALQELIAKGYGCGRKSEIGHCNGGCRGITIPLDHSILNMKDDIVEWFDQELKLI